MALTKEDIDDIFSYHAPDTAQHYHYNAIRDEARKFAQTIIEHTPASTDQTAAIRKLRECVMTANAAIALKGKY